MAVVERTGSKLIIRALGRNLTLQLDSAENFPPSLAKVLCERSGVANSAELIASYESLGVDQLNKQIWEAAAGISAAGGPAYVPFSNTSINSTFIKPDKPFPVPDNATLAAKRKEVQAAYGKQMSAARDAKSKQALASDMLQQATSGLNENSDVAYALLVESTGVAASIGDGGLVVQAIDYMAIAFDEPRTWMFKAKALGIAGRSAGSPQAAKQVVDLCVAQMDEAVKAEQFAAATEFARSALIGARRLGDRKLTFELQERETELKKLERQNNSNS